MRLMLVDDDEISRLPLAVQMRRIAGVSEVIEAQDGEEAWQKLQEGLRPALVCCDLVMPVLGGVELLQRTRESALLADLPFVMISSAADRSSVTQAVAAGAAGFLVKPFVPAAACRTIEKVLREQRAREAEAPMETRHRLGINTDQLLQLSRRLQADVTAILASFETSTPEETEQVNAVRRAHSASVMLGLHRCAEILKPGLDEGAGLEQRRAQLREVGFRLAERLVGAPGGVAA